MKSFLQALLDQLSCANNHSPQSHVLFFARKVGSSERKISFLSQIGVNLLCKKHTYGSHTMKILFLSDIHGSVPALQTVLQFFDQHHFDLLVILGDLLNYGPRNGLPDGLDAPGVVDLLNERADKILAVRGNCDSEVDQMLLHFPIQGTYALLVDEGVKFFLTHGHIYNEQCLPQAPACDVFVYGHTHVMRLEAADEETHRPAILNPGSPTFPKGGNPPTFATWSSGKLALRTFDGQVIRTLDILPCEF